MEKDNLVPGALFPGPLPEFKVGETPAHVESRDVSTTLCQGALKVI